MFDSNIFLQLRKKIIEKSFSKMNEKQREAIFYTEGPLLVLAGAGSGKTTVIVNRIANMIKYGNAYHDTNIPSFVNEDCINNLKEHYSDNSIKLKYNLSVNPIDPGKILTITFTNKAANELKERLVSILGSIGHDIWASTFHSTCAKILRHHAEKLGYTKRFTIYDSDDAKKAIKDCFQKLEINATDKPNLYKSVMSTISNAKDNMINSSDYSILHKNKNDYRLHQMAKIYELYQKHLRDADAMDFDDLIFNTVKLFKKFPDVLASYQEKFHYVLIDEYQDTNKAQYELIRLICEKRKNLCVVGDDDQSIYKFRGATIENILNFEKTYKNTKVVKLEQNYRSTQNILDTANAIIKINKERKEKQLWTNNANGEKIHLHTTYDESGEAIYIAESILKSIAETGANYSDFAVLYRINAQSSVIEKALVKYEIPYKIVSGQRFYDRKEIRNILAYLSVINNPNDNVRLERIINVPRRSIGNKSLSRVTEISEATGQSMLNVMANADKYSELSRSVLKLKKFSELIFDLIEISKDPNVTLSELYQIILDKIDYIESLKLERDNPKTRIENVKELKSIIIRYEEEHKENASLEGFLEEVSLMTDTEAHDGASANVVSLMTIHAAKGLEFSTVFLPGFEDVLFSSTLFNMLIYNSPDCVVTEEERRLVYVAITRAKKSLHIIHAKSRTILGKTNNYGLSRFVNEIPESLIERTEKERESQQKIIASKKRSESYKLAKRKTTVSAKNFHHIVHKKETVIFSIGDNISHKVFGIGTVLSVTVKKDDCVLEIKFLSVGIKKLSANYSHIVKVH